MAITFDPHKSIEDNVVKGELRHIDNSGSFSVVFPLHAPFYYSSLVVKHEGVKLKENIDYYIAHKYQTGELKTAYQCYGSVWLIKKYTGSVELEYHPLGINEATEVQRTTERTTNATEVPTHLDWEDVVGHLYFPPVDVQFNRDDWHGEEKLIEKIDLITDTVVFDPGWVRAFERKNGSELTVHRDAKNLAPSENWDESYANYVVKKVIDFPTGMLDVLFFADNTASIHIDGVRLHKSTDSSWVQERFQKDIGRGKHTVAIVCYNGVGPAAINFSISDGAKVLDVSNNSWSLLVSDDIETACKPMGGQDDMYQLLEYYYLLLKHLVDTSPIHAHLKNKSNPHAEECFWIGALERNGVAPNAVKAFNKTKAQLQAYVNNIAPNPSNLTDKILRNGTKILDSEMRLQPGLGFITASQGRDGFDARHSLVDVTGFFARLHAMANVESTSKSPICIKAGKNVLRVPNSKAEDLTYNSKTVVLSSKAAALVPPNLPGSREVSHVDGYNVTIGGNGKSSSKLTLEWIVPTKELGVPTIDLVSTSYGSSKTLAVSPSLIKDLTAKYVPKLKVATARINGYSLNTDLVLTKADFGRERLDNISDVMLKISNPQQTLLDTYTPKDHAHPFESFGIGKANTSTKGIVKYHSVVDDADDALGSAISKTWKQDLEELDEATDGLMPAGVIAVVRYGVPGTAHIAGTSFSGKTITIPMKIPYYVDSLLHELPTYSVDLSKLYPTGWTNRNYYIYVNYVDSKAVYEVSQLNTLEDSERTLVGEARTNGSGITSFYVRNVTRLGEFREMDEHAASTNAHGGIVVDRETAGLGVVPNVPPMKSLRTQTDGTLDIERSNLFATMGGYLEMMSGHGTIRVVTGEHTGLPAAANYHAALGLIATPKFKRLDGTEYTLNRDLMWLRYNGTKYSLYCLLDDDPLNRLSSGFIWGELYALTYTYTNDNTDMPLSRPMSICSRREWNVPQSKFFARVRAKCVAGEVYIEARSDDWLSVWVGGKLLMPKTGTCATLHKLTVTVTEGEHDFAFLSENGAVGGYLAFTVVQNGRVLYDTNRRVPVHPLRNGENHLDFLTA